MPKVVDPVERRLAVTAAVWRVVRRDGLDQASVRNVAREAGLSAGALRHYFATQSELLVFTLRMIMERIERRIAELPAEPDPRRRAELVLAELLPMDAERAAENEVWLAFTARSMVDPELRALRNEGYDALRAGCRRLVEDLARAILERPIDQDVRPAVERKPDVERPGGRDATYAAVQLDAGSAVRDKGDGDGPGAQDVSEDGGLPGGRAATGVGGRSGGRARWDVEGEGDRLHALVDGLAVHAAMRPDVITPEKMRAVVARHLDDLERAVA